MLFNYIFKCILLSEALLSLPLIASLILFDFETNKLINLSFVFVCLGDRNQPITKFLSDVQFKWYLTHCC